MEINVSEQVVSMLAVFLTVSLAAERVVQVLKNGLRWVNEWRKKLWQKRKTASEGERAPKAGRETGLRDIVAVAETEGNWAKFWPRAMAVVAGSFIAYWGAPQIIPVLKGIFPETKKVFEWHEAAIIGLFSAAGSDLWSQLLGIIKEVKGAKKLNIDESIQKILDKQNSQTPAT